MMYNWMHVYISVRAVTRLSLTLFCLFVGLRRNQSCSAENRTRLWFTVALHYQSWVRRISYTYHSPAGRCCSQRKDYCFTFQPPACWVCGVSTLRSAPGAPDLLPNRVQEGELKLRASCLLVTGKSKWTEVDRNKTQNKTQSHYSCCNVLWHFINYLSM